MRRVLLLTILLAVAACGAPPPPPPPAANPPAPVVGPVTLAPRPRTIRLDGIDPCSLLSAPQLGALGLGGEPRGSTENSPLYGSTRLCTVFSLVGKPVAVTVVLADRTGIDVWTRGTLAAAVAPVTIGGFPSILSRVNAVPDACNVQVDIAPGQLVDVQVHDGGDKPPIPQDELCRQAQAAAEQVMTVLTKR